MDERDAYIGLNMMEKIGPVGVRSLVRELGSAAAIFSAPAGDMMRADGIGADTARRIVEQRDTVDIEGEKDRAARDGGRVIDSRLGCCESRVLSIWLGLAKETQ